MTIIASIFFFVFRGQFIRVQTIKIQD